MFLYSVYNLYKTRVMNIIYFNNIALHKTLMKQRAIFPLIQNIIGIKNDNPNYNKDYQKVKITY